MEFGRSFGCFISFFFGKVFGLLVFVAYLFLGCDNWLDFAGESLGGVLTASGNSSWTGSFRIVCSSGSAVFTGEVSDRSTDHGCESKKKQNLILKKFKH